MSRNKKNNTFIYFGFLDRFYDSFKRNEISGQFDGLNIDITRRRRLSPSAVVKTDEKLALHSNYSPTVPFYAYQIELSE